MKHSPLAQFDCAFSAAADVAGFSQLLARCPTDADRKLLILAAHDHGALDVAETMMLISAMMLEAA